MFKTTILQYVVETLFPGNALNFFDIQATITDTHDEIVGFRDLVRTLNRGIELDVLVLKRNMYHLRIPRPYKLFDCARENCVSPECSFVHTDEEREIAKKMIAYKHYKRTKKKYADIEQAWQEEIDDLKHLLMQKEAQVERRNVLIEKLRSKISDQQMEIISIRRQLGEKLNRKRKLEISFETDQFKKHKRVVTEILGEREIVD